MKLNNLIIILLVLSLMSLCSTGKKGWIQVKIKVRLEYEEIWHKYKIPNAYMKKICDKYGVEFRTTAHCLRHTYATILYEASIDELTACKLMGHADIKTTMKIYTHLREEHEARNITKLDEYLSKRA